MGQSELQAVCLLSSEQSTKPLQEPFDFQPPGGWRMQEQRRSKPQERGNIQIGQQRTSQPPSLEQPEGRRQGKHP